MSGGSSFADAGAARRAIALVEPALAAAAQDRSVCGSGFFCIVVMDPALGPQDCAFDRAVLVEHAVGDRARWDADYAAFARAKAEAAWRHGQAAGAIGAHALRDGECLLGGAVRLDGIVVGVSGAFEAFDEAFALAVAAQLRALARQRRDAAVQGGAWRAARAAG